MPACFRSCILVFVHTCLQCDARTRWRKHDGSYILKFPWIIIDCCVLVEVLAVILKERISFFVAWRGMTDALKLSRHHLWKQIIAICWILVSVTKGKSSTNEKLSGPSLGCASQMAMSWCVCQPMRLPSVLVVTRVRWFRGWGGREGNCPVSGVVSVGGLVSFTHRMVLKQGCEKKKTYL